MDNLPKQKENAPPKAMLIDALIFSVIWHKYYGEHTYEIVWVLTQNTVRLSLKRSTCQYGKR